MKNLFEQRRNQSSDINEHLPTLKELSSECDTITEMGVRNVVSTWAFLNGYPKKLTSYDIIDPPKSNLQEAMDFAQANNIDFNFFQKNVLSIEIEETDLLFIDTKHTYEQLKQELEKHSNKAKKYIILHDTVTYGIRAPQWLGGGEGLLKAIFEFLDKTDDWFIYKEYKNNNGLMILKRR